MVKMLSENVEECKAKAATVFRAPTHLSLQFVRELCKSVDFNGNGLSSGHL